MKATTPPLFGAGSAFTTHVTLARSAAISH